MDGSHPITVARSATVDARELQRGLAFVTQASQRWNMVPILGTLRIEALEGDRLRLECTDLDNTATVTLAESVVTSAAPFAAQIRPALLRPILRGYSGPVQMDYLDDAASPAPPRLRIKAGDMTATFQLLILSGDWPAAPAPEVFGDALTMGNAQLAKALRKVQPCISTEETRYYLNGALMQARDGHLRTVATDGHRLACFDTPEAAWTLPDLIFPITALRILAAALEAQPNGQTVIRAEITDRDKDKPYVKRLHFTGDGWELTSKTIDGTYPDYTRVMPPLADEITATLSYAALNRFPTTSCDCALKIDPEAGIMSMRMVDQEGDFAVPVQGKGKAFGVNIHYLKDFARPAGIIRLQSGKPGDPLYCLTDDPNLQQVVMPMRI